MKDKPINKSLEVLLEKARDHVMTPEELREQRISWAYGNAAIDNPSITREMVEREYDKLYGESK